MQTTVCDADAWATLDEVTAQPGASGLTDEQAETGRDVAADLLWRFSAHRWPGNCTATVRPSAQPHGGESRFGPSTGWVWSDTGAGCGCHRRNLVGCNGVSAVTLGLFPIVSVDQVLVDGELLDPSGYRVDDDRWLVRLPDGDGPAAWPCCQDLAKPDTAEGTWSVTVTYGGAPPPSGQAAAAALAAEIAKHIAGSDDCALSDRVTSVTREGISYELLASGNQGKADGFGIATVRMFLEAVNPTGARGRSKVIDPDSPRFAVRPATGAGS